MLHKIIYNEISLTDNFLPKFSRNTPKFQQVLGRVLAYSNSFVPIATKWWNQLPDNLIKTENKAEFSNELMKHLKLKL